MDSLKVSIVVQILTEIRQRGAASRVDANCGVTYVQLARFEDPII